MFDLNNKNIRERKWYVVYAKARSEMVARDNLSRQGFAAYLPRVESTKRRRGQLSSQVEAFFPRYLFVQLDLQTDHWGSIRSTRGVCGLVQFEGQPKEVPEELIVALKNNENSDELQNVTQPSWCAGDRVVIEQGPFAGYSCIFQGRRSKDRVAVLLDIVGKPTHSTFAYQDLQLPEFA